MSLAAVAIHEAGHAVLALAGRLPVTRIDVSETGGGVQLGGSGTPGERLRLTWAGAIAVAVLHDERSPLAEPSAGDLDIIRRAEDEWIVAHRLGRYPARERQRVQDEVYGLVAEHESSIRGLAAVLELRRVMTAADLLVLIHTDGSALARYRPQWPTPPARPKPAPTPAARGRGLGPASPPPGSPPGTRWSPEHGCYVGPLTPEERQRRQRREPSLADLIGAVLGRGGLAHLIPGGGYPSVSAGGRLL